MAQRFQRDYGLPAYDAAMMTQSKATAAFFETAGTWPIEGGTKRLLDAIMAESTAEVRVVLELKKDADPQLVMAYLFKNTPLATHVQVNLTCLIPSDNPEIAQPKRLGLAETHSFKDAFVKRLLANNL